VRGKAFRAADADLNKLYAEIQKRLTTDDQKKKLVSAEKGSVANLAGGGIPGIWTPVG